jgi:hypothetical protein
VLCLYEETFGQLWSSKTRDSENLSSVAFQSQKLDARLRTTAAGLLRAVEHVRRMLARIAVVKIWTANSAKKYRDEWARLGRLAGTFVLTLY